MIYLKEYKTFDMNESISKNTKQFIAIRSGQNDNVVAIINISTNLNDNQILPIIKQSVTEWCDKFEVGKKALIYSSDDFNFGDLALYQDDKDLISILSSSGINELTIQTIELDRMWGFDTILLNK